MMELIGATLTKHGLGFEDLFECAVMLADMSGWAAFDEIYAGCFEPGRYPARSAMGVSGLALGARVEMECRAYAPAAGRPRGPMAALRLVNPGSSSPGAAPLP